jgi:hypothetical protein
LSREPTEHLARRRWPIAALIIVILFVTGFGVVRPTSSAWADASTDGRRIENWIDPPPDRATLPTVVVTGPSPSPTPRSRGSLRLPPVRARFRASVGA